MKNIFKQTTAVSEALPRPGRSVCVFIPFILVVVAVFVATGCSSSSPDEGAEAMTAKQMNINSLLVHAQQQASRIKAVSRIATIQRPAARFQAGLAEGQRMGTFEIPRIGIKEWIVQGTEKDDLELGAGHIIQTSIPGMGGNFAIAGDRVLYSAPLLRADQLQEGDEIMVQMPYADFDYVINSITVVTPDDVSVIRPKGYDSITFSTCDPPWGVNTRIIISAKLARSEPTT
jgi:sortase A